MIPPRGCSQCHSRQNMLLCVHCCSTSIMCTKEHVVGAHLLTVLNVRQPQMVSPVTQWLRTKILDSAPCPPLYSTSNSRVNLVSRSSEHILSLTISINCQLYPVIISLYFPYYLPWYRTSIGDPHYLWILFVWIQLLVKIHLWSWNRFFWCSHGLSWTPKERTNLSHPMSAFPAEVKQGTPLPSCFSSYPRSESFLRSI